MNALFGRYEYVGELGRGATSRVIRVSDRAEGGAARALKVVAEDDAAWLAWEFARLSQVLHPRLARVYEVLRLAHAVHEPFGLAARAMILVEQLAEGESWSRHAGREASVPARAERSAWHVAVCVAEALAALHDAGLVHGDVKPENVIVDGRTGDAMLVDLGFARAPGENQPPRGTPRMMAPELFAGTCTFAADVFALGASLHDVLIELTARDSSSRSGASGIARTFTPIRGVSDELSALVQRFTAPDPRGRPRDGREALGMLLVAGEKLRFAAEGSSMRVASSRPDRAPRVLAQRARCLPYVGDHGLVTGIVDALETHGTVLVRGVRGAGRARAAREGVRALHESRALRGRGGPTCVTTLSQLDALAAESVLVLLEDATQDELERAQCVRDSARLAGRDVLVIATCAPAAVFGSFAHVDVQPLSDESLRALLLRALARRHLSPAVIDSIARVTDKLAGRVCEVVAECLLAGRDVDDPASYRKHEPPTDVLHTLSASAAELLAMFAWSSARSVTPAEVDRRLGADGPVALDELAARGALEVVDGCLQARASVARATRAATRDHARRHLLDTKGDAPNGFSAWARGDHATAATELVRELLSLRARGRHDEARELGEEALTLVDDEAVRLALADAHRAAAHYARALELLEAARSPRALLLRAEVARLAGRADAAWLDLERLRSSGETWARARATALAARVAYDRGELDEARRLVARLDESDPDAELRALEVRILLAWSRGENDRKLTARMVERAGVSETPRFRARALALRAQSELRYGERRRALDDYREAIDLARRLGETHESATYGLNAGLVELEAGELGAALETLDGAAYRLSLIDRPRDLVRVLFNLGNAALLVGDDARAEVVLSEARRRLAVEPDELAEALTAAAWSELCLRRGDVDGAVAALRAVHHTEEDGYAVRAVVAARLAQALLVVDALDAAAVACVDAERACPPDDVSTRLEVEAAVIRVKLAQGDAANAEQRARTALALATDEAPFAERVRLLLVAVDAARAVGAERESEERAALCRALLERALSGLSSARRAAMRALPAFARVLAMPSRARAAGERTSERWRRMVRAARVLFAQRTRGALAGRVVEEMLELVHAERAMLVVARGAGDALELVAHAVLGDASVPPAFSRSVAERALSEHRAVVTLEASRDERFDEAQSVHSLSVRSVLAVPVEGFGARAVLMLDDRVRSSAFDAEDVALVEDFAMLAGQAARAIRERRAQERRVRRAELEHRALSAEVDRLAALKATPAPTPIVHASAAMQRALELARRAAMSDVPILIAGESGTGKELVARFVHDASRRRTMPFVAESCAALPETLLESTLFGHVRGAFTGADRAKKGLFEIADGGTLLLDEVGEMSPALQAKLLRVLQEGEIRPLGSERTRRVDVRVLAATHRDLLELVRRGTFREDLYYRLAVLTVELPPLRERREDVPLLVSHFATKHGEGRSVRVAPEVMRALEAEPWPGNVRELENRVRRGLVLAEDELRLEHVGLDRKASVPLGEELDLHAQTELLTRSLVEQALARSAGNLTQAAELLGISRFGLQKMVKRLGLGPYGARSRK